MEVSYDGGKTYEPVDTVIGNTDAITDRKLLEPVTSQYFRLRIDDSENSPWSAIRIYEFQLFQDTYTEQVDYIFKYGFTSSRKDINKRV